MVGGRAGNSGEPDRDGLDRAGAAPGIVSAWGSNEDGQLGDGTNSGPDTCGSIACSKIPLTVAGLSGVTALAAGSYHSLALLSNGTVLAWGDNSSGELGDGTTTNRLAPVTVTGLSGVVAIAAGHYWSAAVLSNGTVMVWGSNYFGSLGNGGTTGPEKCGFEGCSTTPIPVAGVSGAVAIGGGYGDIVALRSNGTVMVWGDDDHGQLGNGTTAPDSCGVVPCSTSPIVVSGVSGATAIGTGDSHNLALLSNGTVMAWGANGGGELGNGTSGADSSTPVAVSGLSGVSAVTAGSDHSLALRPDGTVMAWGRNQNGQLGLGSTTGPDTCGSSACSTTPVAVGGLSGVSAIVAGDEHTLALLPNGAVMAWGLNNSAQLGDGTTTNRPAPAAVSGLGGVVTLGAGDEADHGLVVQGAFASVSPAGLAFGSQLTGTASAPRSVTVTNSGPAPLSISGDSLTGAGAFHTTTDNCAGATLAAGASCQTVLDFAPTAPGAATASLALQSTAANALAPVALSGSGLTPAPLPVAPVISGAQQTHGRWRLGTKLAQIGRNRTPVGTTFSFRISAAARVQFAFTQGVSGRRVGNRCVAPSKQNRKKRKCTRAITAATLSFAGHAGANKVSFQGRVSPTRKLAPGHYTLVITATNPAGRSAPVALGFTIVKR